MDVELAPEETYDAVVTVVALESTVVVGLVGGASGICRGWECAPGELAEVLEEAGAYARLCAGFTRGGLI